MLWFVIAAGLSFYAYVRFDEWKNPRSKGKFEDYPKVKLQEKSSEVARPRQGSSTQESVDSGVLYLVTHSGFNSAKIGISSNSSQSSRLQDHTEHGWKIEGLWVFERLKSAEQIEGAVIAWWRNSLSLKPSCNRLTGIY
jgi:hypothetical protein